MGIRKLAAVAGVMAVVFAACGGSAATTAPATAAPATEAPATAAPASEAPASEAPASAAAACVVGVSWNNYQEERWAKWDEPAIKAALEAGGGKYISNDAKSSAETQATNVENLISQGAKVVIVLAQDGTAIKPAVAARDRERRPGHRLRPPDRGPERPLHHLRQQARRQDAGRGPPQGQGLQGNFVVIKGNKADANADFLRAGMVEAGLPPTSAPSTDKLKIVGETYTDNWDPANAQKKMEQFLTANDNKIDIAFVENDGMAGGVIAALTAQGLAGKVPVSGQDGDGAALNRVALGTQTVDVWKDARELGKAAGEAAVAAVRGHGHQEGRRRRRSSPTPGGNDMTSILLTPQPITKDNLNVVLDAGWITKDDLCKDVPAGSVAACG